MTEALSGYRILDLTDESGEYGTKVLAALGAEVIKVEPPDGSRTRRLPPLATTSSGSKVSLFFAYMNTSKLSVTLDLNCSDGQGLFRSLSDSSDAILDTSHPGYMAERGIGYEQLRHSNPKLVWVAQTPFGLTGPRRDWKGSNLVTWASSSGLFTNGFPDGPPVAIGGSSMLAYALSSLNAAAGCLLALKARTTTGEGQLVDVAMQEVAVTCIMGEAPLSGFLDDLILRVRNGNRRLVAVPWGMYACKDGYVQLAVLQPAHWIILANWVKEETEHDEIAEKVFEDFHMRLQTRDLLEGWIEDLTKQYHKQDFFEAAQRRGIPASPVNTVADLVDDPQLAARHFWTELSDPALGRVRLAGPPVRFSKTPWQTRRAPTLGEHNELVYGERLGMSQTELASLRAKRVV